ncbi:MAG: hypothetical protein COZ08_11840, partial [Bacteroidetes bacterium CG_4_10_14_3_um_filter_42_6]
EEIAVWPLVMSPYFCCCLRQSSLEVRDDKISSDLNPFNFLAASLNIFHFAIAFFFLNGGNVERA